jgi:hypothetical protein
VIKGAFNVVQAFVKTVTARNIQYVFGEKKTHFKTMQKSAL